MVYYELMQSRPTYIFYNKYILILFRVRLSVGHFKFTTHLIQDQAIIF